MMDLSILSADPSAAKPGGAGPKAGLLPSAHAGALPVLVDRRRCRTASSAVHCGHFRPAPALLGHGKDLPVPVRFRLLGNIEAEVDGRPVDLGPARRRCVLAALLADVDHPVPAGRLACQVWADRPPDRARRNLASYLSRLRRGLAGTGDVVNAHGPGGYALRVAPKAIDLHRFRALVSEARSAQALARFGEALER
jgi:hypothetical protein